MTTRHQRAGGSRPTRVAGAAISQVLAIALAAAFAVTFGATPMYIVAVALVTAVGVGVVLAALGAQRARVISIDGPVAAIAGRDCELRIVARAPRLVAVEARQDGAVVARWSQRAGECRGAVTARFAHRGVVDRLDVVATCAGPFGTWRWARPGTVVLGAPVAVGPAVLPSTAARATPAPADGTGTSPMRRSEPGALHGVRPWSDGDPISWVHWPSAARTGELLVREWEPPDDPRVDVRVDRCADAATAERTTGLAAGAIDAALAQGAVVHLTVPSADGATRTVVVQDRWSTARTLAEADLPRLTGESKAEDVAGATSGWPARAAVVAAVMLASGALLGALSWPVVPTAISLCALPLAVLVGARLDRRGEAVVRAAAAMAAVAVVARMALDVADAGGGARLDGVRDGLVELLLALMAIHTATAAERTKLRFSLGASTTMIGYAAAVRLDGDVVWWAAAWLVAVGVAFAALHADEVDRSVGAGGALARPSPAHRPRHAARTALVIVAAAAVGLAVLVLVPVPEGPLRVLSTSFLPSRLRVPGEGSLGAVGADGTVVVSEPDRPSAPGVAAAFGYPAFEATFDLAQRGRRPGNDVVMRVRAPREDFWRGQTFELFDGRRWHVAGDIGWLQAGPAIVVPPARGDVVGAPSEEMFQTFSLEMDVPNLVFAAQRPTGVQLDADVWMRDDGALRADSVLPAGTRYTVVSERPLVTEAGLVAQGSPQSGAYVDRWRRPDLGVDLQLPPSTSDRVRALAHEITDPYPDVFTKEKAIEQWMADHVEYDLDAPVPPEGADAVDHFLFESRRGFCEQIASATVVMLRAVGVPARVAAGYTPGERDPLTGVFVVRNRDAHGWTEVWFPATGWQAFDPTASVPLAGDSAGSRSLGAPIVGAIARWIARWSVPIAAFVVLAAMAWLVVRRRSIRRRRRRSPAWDAQRRFERLCRGAGVRAAPSDSNEVLAARLADRSCAVAGAAASAAAAVDHAAFGTGDPGEARAKVDALADALRA